MKFYDNPNDIENFLINSDTIYAKITLSLLYRLEHLEEKNKINQTWINLLACSIVALLYILIIL